MKTQQNFGSLIKTYRAALGLTQLELAERVACSTDTIKKIEAGKRHPSRDMAQLLARELRIPSEEKPAFLALARGLDPNSLPASELLEPSSPLLLPTTALVDRHSESDEILRLLRQPEIRILTLTGPGGVGKTRLAMQTAQTLQTEFADGMALINLSSVFQPELFLLALALALGFSMPNVDAARKRLRAYFSGKQLLLVLDNFEQILPAASEVQEFIVANPGLKVLVTSRASLHLRGEQEYPVPPMGLPNLADLTTPAALLENSPAVDLFVRRVRAVRPGFHLTTQNLQPIAEICILLDGLPLALELAAARCKMLDPISLLRQLQHTRPLNLLTGGQQDLPRRQQTIRATLDWSYHLLEAPEQMVFSNLGAFIGSASLDAIEYLTEDAHLDVLNQLTGLINHNLAWSTENSMDQTRIQMLTTVREYAFEKLVESGRLESVRERQATFFVEFVEKTIPLLRGPHFLTASRQLAADHENLRVVLDWCCANPPSPTKTEFALRITANLWEYWISHGSNQEAISRIEQALNLPGTEEFPMALAHTLNNYGLAISYASRNGAPYVEQALEIFRKNGDIYAEALALEHLAECECQDRSPVQIEKSLSLLQTSLELFQRAGSYPWNLGWAYQKRANIFNQTNRMEEALIESEKSLNMFIACSSLHGQANTYYNRGFILERIGNLPAALSAMENGLSIFEMLEMPNAISGIHRTIGRIQIGLGMYTEAWNHLTTCLKIEKRGNDKWGLAYGLLNYGLLLGVTGHPEAATSMVGAAHTLFLQALEGSLGGYEEMRIGNALEIIKKQLDEATFNRCWQTGQFNPLQQLAIAEQWPGPNK